MKSRKKSTPKSKAGKNSSSEPAAKRAKTTASSVCCGTYEAYIEAGLLQNIPAQLTKLLSDASKFAIITDENVGELYAKSLKNGIAAATKKPVVVKVLPPGEQTKCRAVKAQVEDWMLESGCDRQSCLVALGGGVIGDLVGFIASTYMRGIAYVHIPTSLLAMVDSSIGAKTGIDTDAGKNLIGAFYRPKAVFADVSVLKTLPDRHLYNGMAEVIKTAAIRNESLFEFLEFNVDKVCGRDSTTLEHIVRECVQIKADVVLKDEHESGLREILNFGHSIGHAIEALSLDYGMLHGEAVAIGMMQEAMLARTYQHLQSVHLNRLESSLKAYKLPLTLPAHLRCATSAILDKMKVDKKNKGGKKQIVMLRSIGSVVESPYSTSVPDPELCKLLCESSAVMPGVANGSIEVPGSKSISNRVLLLAAMAKGTCRIRGLLHSDDTLVMLAAIRELGIHFSWEENDTVLVVHGSAGQIKEPSTPIMLNNAGTASRFLTSFCSTLASGTCILTGNHRMKERPIGDLVDALRANGSIIDYEEAEGSLPIKITGTGGLHGGEIILSPNTSSQYVSSILLSAPLALKPLTLRLDTSQGPVVSKPYIDMTLALMKDFGIEAVEVEPFVYQIPKAHYVSPPELLVEGDASSASYPLALAAITGGTVTVANVGSKSLQGDAKLCFLMERMGCKVEQTTMTTTVTGPPPGGLVGVDVDMDTMTDCFMTICAVAAFAKGTTRITNISNQRVKECNRIEVMVSELQKCGVNASELETGISVDGYDMVPESVDWPVIKCHYDHRIAMSFACLGARVAGVILDEKRCVDKTYPEFWDHIDRYLGLKSQTDVHTHVSSSSASPSSTSSIVIVGMRGAGKSTLGAHLAKSLQRVLVDIDAEIEVDIKCMIRDYVNEHGWEAFRAKELEVFQRVVHQHPQNAVIVCGGGIVETPAALQLLVSLPVVIQIHRDIDDIVAYLDSDPTRPPFDARAVWAKREPLFQKAARYEYMIPKGRDWVSQVAPAFLKWCRRVVGLDTLELNDGTFFLSLTFPTIEECLPILDQISEGSDALELRVDLLANHSPKHVVSQYTLLRSHTHLPVIFTVRSKGQGGGFEENESKIFDLLRLAVRHGCEYIDMESHWSESSRHDLLTNRGCSKIIASHHFFNSNGGSDEDLRRLFHNVSHHGRADVVKVVTMAYHFSDAVRLLHIGQSLQLVNDPKLIVLAMGEKGKLSRVLNQFFSPVTHPALPAAAAPGQLSVQQIQTIRTAIGLCDSKKFHIFGSPVGRSPSPFMHNNGFKWLGLPYHYTRVDTADPEECMKYINDPCFGGASVTIPLKEKLLSHMDSVSEAVTKIGAMNTITRTSDGRLLGDNTDWIGICEPLRSAMTAFDLGDSVAVVVGAGGTARAALYALNQLGISGRRLYVHNPRTPEKADALASEFSCSSLSSIDTLGGADTNLCLILSTLPGSAGFTVNPSLLCRSPKPVMFDVSYLPFEGTALCQQAEAEGCQLIRGIDMLIAQGLQQSAIWTGRRSQWPSMETAVREAYQAKTL